MKAFPLAFLLICGAATTFAAPPAPRVVVITIDGLRWQEVFTGADPAYFKPDAKGNIDPLSKK